MVLTAGWHLSTHLPNAVLQETVRAFYHGWYRDLVTELPKLEGGRSARRPARGSGWRCGRKSGNSPTCTSGPPGQA